jgi:hypothetical protein
MNSPQSSLGAKPVLPQLDRRAFMRLPVQQRRALLELQAIGEPIYTPKSEAMEWLEQDDEFPNL